MVVKRYRMKLALLSEIVRRQFAEYEKASDVTGIVVEGPYVEQDLKLLDGCDRSIVDDMHGRMLAAGWEFVEDDPKTRPTIVCCDADGNEVRLEDKLKEISAVG